MICQLCPKDLRSSFIDSHIQFLTSNELTPLFTPPKVSHKKILAIHASNSKNKKPKVLEEEYDKARKDIVYSFLMELKAWGTEVRPQLYKWVDHFINTKFFEPKYRKAIQTWYQEGK